MQMQSTMPNQEFFTKAQSVEMSRSQFDRSHTYKTTFNAGRLIPFYVDEALPSDTINLQCRVFGRLATPLKPVMDNIFIDVHFFSVPYRLVWTNFKRFMGEQEFPEQSTDLTIPTITAPVGGFLELSNFDYMGIPTKIAGLEISALPSRAINLIWNEWYRDQDLQQPLTVNKGDTDFYNDYDVALTRAKRKDYFTSARPWAQKGVPTPIPLTVTNPFIKYDVSLSGGPVANNKFVVAKNTSDSLSQFWYGDTKGTSTAFNSVPSEANLYADMTNSIAGTIDQLNAAYKIQSFLQRESRSGTRYTEQIQSAFGVVSPDARLQRPEFLGGGTTYVNVNPVTQTTPASGGSTPQGNLAAYGTFSGEPAGFVKSFTEHEIVIGFLSARADLTYQQGLDRMWSRRTRFDFYWREFANLGEQAIYNKEIYAQGTSADDDAFGYAERWSEYRFKNSKITGLFRSNATASLDVWHLSQEFGSLPILGSIFIGENPPIDRIVAVPSEPDFIVDIVCDEKWARPMPIFAIPSFSTKF